MKLFPYSRIETNTLSIVLFVARFLFVFGILVALALVCFSTYEAFLKVARYVPNPNGQGSRGYAEGWSAYLRYIWPFVGCICMITCSCILAAIVSIEQKLSKQDS